MKESLSGTVDQGSVWRRWDPHLHAPGTLLNDQYTADWEAFLQAVNTASPRIEALGVTDYFCIRGYQQARAHKVAGKLPNVGLLFPNVEMRLDIKTEKAKGINIHLLFSPADQEHETHILRLLGGLSFDFREVAHPCTPQGLVALGRAFHRKPLDEDAAMSIGAMQFKTTLPALRALMKDRWAIENCLAGC